MKSAGWHTTTVVCAAWAVHDVGRCGVQGDGRSGGTDFAFYEAHVAVKR
ncbi:MAG: hypothetical protein KJZ84_08300 [Bryobacteraceae bacterium]|nr:hypothetical protein [Bryobacteraceae bacterium]